MTPAEIVQFAEEQTKRDWHLAWWTALLTRIKGKHWPASAADLWNTPPTAPKTQSLAAMGKVFGMMKANADLAKKGADRRTIMRKE